MFNRQLRVDVVKTKKSDTENVRPTRPVNHYAQAYVLAREVGKNAALAIGTYIAADTTRKIVLHIVTTKIR